MGIQKDAEEILVYLYKLKTKGNELPNFGSLLNITKWEEHKLKNATQYLMSKGLTNGHIIHKVNSKEPPIFVIEDLTPEGIDTIENKDKFKREFSHKINLGFYTFSWGASDK